MDSILTINFKYNDWGTFECLSGHKFIGKNCGWLMESTKINNKVYNFFVIWKNKISIIISDSIPSNFLEENINYLIEYLNQIASIINKQTNSEKINFFIYLRHYTEDYEGEFIKKRNFYVWHSVSDIDFQSNRESSPTKKNLDFVKEIIEQNIGEKENNFRFLDDLFNNLKKYFKSNLGKKPYKWSKKNNA